MAYRTGPITDADPAARYVEQIEGTMLDQCGLAWVANTAYGGVSPQPKFVRGLTGGINYRFEATTPGTSHSTTEPDWSTAATLGQTLSDGSVTWTNRGRATWEFVEQVTLVTLNYRIWRNRGSGAANPNQWGVDYYVMLSRQAAATIRAIAFESWDATNKKMIRPCVANANIAVNADGSGGLAAGYDPNSLASPVTVTGFGGLVTTGFNYYIRATRDVLFCGVKQSATDDFFALGVFQSFLTSSPTELFPLFMMQSRGLGNNAGFATTSTSACSRHPGRNSAAAATFNFRLWDLNAGFGLGLLGGIDTPTIVDFFHNNSWLAQRVLVQNEGGSQNSGNLPATYGRVRGAFYDDVIILANNGAAVRIGDTVTLSGDVYVRYTNAYMTYWLKRDAI